MADRTEQEEPLMSIATALRLKPCPTLLVSPGLLSPASCLLHLGAAFYVTKKGKKDAKKKGRDRLKKMLELFVWQLCE